MTYVVGAVRRTRRTGHSSCKGFGAGGDGGRGGHGGGIAYGINVSGPSDPQCAGVAYDPPGSGGTGGLGGIGRDVTGNRGADGAFGERNVTTPSCP